MAPREHEWTDFELHTLLCLMARGVHLPPVKMKRNQDEGVARQHAHVDVATDLNTALYGKANFVNDISKRDVSKMIDRILSEKKGIMGPAGYMERSKFPRITRGLKRAFERHSKLDYDGSLSEWKLWRKEEEAEKRRLQEEGAPHVDVGDLGTVVKSVEYDDRNGRWRDTDEQRAERRDITEEMRQDYLSGGYDRTPRRVEQPPTLDLDTNIWAQADMAAATSQSHTQWGRTTPPYIPPVRPCSATDPNSAENSNHHHSHARQSNIFSEPPLQHHPSLPVKPHVLNSGSSSITHAASPPNNGTSDIIHSLPKKPVSILKSSKGKTHDQFSVKE